jgi:hypothetical protein
MSAGYEAAFHEFSERPVADSCWSLSTGPDGRIYAASCIEHTPGEAVTIVRYDEGRDALEYLFDIDKVTGDLRDSGRATQCKVHYGFAPSPRTGLLYSATHLSGAPKGERSYCPWSAWHDARRAFLGSMLVAYDTVKEEVAWWELMIPKEGCRCLALDEERERLYAVTYPRDHFVVYDLARKSLTDIGRIGSVNTQCIFLDGKRRAYLTDDRGRFVRFDPDAMQLDTLPHVFPHSCHQTGWHGVLYDAVADDERGSVYMVPWMPGPRLVRFWPEEGPDGRVEDLGRVNQAVDPTLPVSMSLDHVGGLVFGTDGFLYFVKSTWPGGSEARTRGWYLREARGVVVRMDPETLEKEEVCTLDRGEEAPSNYVSRGARDRVGNLYFGHVGPRPVGVFRMTVPGAGEKPEAHLPLRMWG